MNANPLPRYTVRPLGKIGWADADTLTEAIKLAEECRQRISNETIVIYDNQEEREVSAEEFDDLQDEWYEEENAG